MNDTITYGKLGAYLRARREENTADHAVRQCYTAWNRFERDLSDLAATSITQEHTDKAVERFEEVADLRPMTITNYARSFRRSVNDYLDYVGATGNVEYVSVPASPDLGEHDSEANSGTLTYGDAWEYFLAYRHDNPDDINGKHWVSAFSALSRRVPIEEMTISPEHTDYLLEKFDRATAKEKKENRLKRSTVSSYRNWFRQAAREYCERIGIDYPEPDASERRRRTRVARQARAAALAAPDDHETVTEAATTENTAQQDEGLIGYAFLLRPGLPLTVALPDDLTRAEADRLSQWVSSFVIETP